MHRARAFFFVCAGLFLLALSYHLGARSAGAQVSITAAGAALGFNAAVGRTVYTLSFGGSPVVRPPVPGTDAIVAVDGNGSGNTVLLANGDGYAFNPNSTPGGWILQGNIFSGGPTSAQRETFGSLKVKYRGERAVQPAPEGR